MAVELVKIVTFIELDMHVYTQEMNNNKHLLATCVHIYHNNMNAFSISYTPTYWLHGHIKDQQAHAHNYMY